MDRNNERREEERNTIDLGDVAEMTNGSMTVGIPDEFNDLARVSGGISAE